MGKQETHRFFICMAVFATIVALLVLVCIVPQQQQQDNRSQKVITTTTPSPLPQVPEGTHFEVCQLDKVLTTKDHMDLSKKAIKEKMSKEVPSQKLMLRDKVVNKVTIEKNFFIYDVQVLSVSDHFLVTILMELPPVRVWYEDKEYYQFYPLINPYIHVVELTYKWGFNPYTLEMDKDMTLESMKLHMVGWDSNRYYTMFIQTKNSPLYLSKIPKPIPFTEKELHSFLQDTKLLDTINMGEGMTAKPSETSTSPVRML